MHLHLVDTDCRSQLMFQDFENYEQPSSTLSPLPARKRQEKQERVLSNTPRSISVSSARAKEQQSSIVGSLTAVLRCWWRHPLLIVTCVATGTRLGAGYIWYEHVCLNIPHMMIEEFFNLAIDGVACP